MLVSHLELAESGWAGYNALSGTSCCQSLLGTALAVDRHAARAADSRPGLAPFGT